MTFDGNLDKRISQHLNISKLFDFTTARGLSCKIQTIPFLVHLSKMRWCKKTVHRIDSLSLSVDNVVSSKILAFGCYSVNDRLKKVYLCLVWMCWFENLQLIPKQKPQCSIFVMGLCVYRKATALRADNSRIIRPFLDHV